MFPPNKSKMKKATVILMAFVVTFIAEHSTTRYLLVEIDGDIDGGPGFIGGIGRVGYGKCLKRLSYV